MLTRFQWVAVLILGAIALALNAWNWHLSAQIEGEMNSRRAVEGVQLKEMPVFNLDSAFPTLKQSEAFQADTRQLLFFLSPSCPFCRDNLPTWQKIENRLDPQAIRLIALSSSAGEGIQLYQEALQVPILVSADLEARKANHLIRVPQTVLIDPQGRVERNWTGDISAHLDEIGELLGVSLH